MWRVLSTASVLEDAIGYRTHMRHGSASTQTTWHPRKVSCTHVALCVDPLSPRPISPDTIPTMRILIINQPYWPDVVATAQHLADWTEHLIALGHQVTVIASRSVYGKQGAILPKRETHKGVTIYRVGANFFQKGASSPVSSTSASSTSSPLPAPSAFRARMSSSASPPRPSSASSECSSKISAVQNTSNTKWTSTPTSPSPSAR